MGLLDIRGQEVQLKIQVDGDLQSGSFEHVEDFKLTPRTDLSDNDFIGEPESEPDIMHHGFDFSFSTRERDSKISKLFQEIVAAEQTSSPQPTINLVAIYKYRDTGAGTRTAVMQNCKLKLDSHDVGGRREYVKNSWSGKCQRVAEL